MAMAFLLLGGGSFALGFSSTDPNPALVPLVRRAGAKVYLVALPWRLVEPKAVKFEGLTVKKALEDPEVLKDYSKSVDWSSADELLSSILRAGAEPLVGVGWGWKDMVPRSDGGLFCPDYVGYERYRAHFVLHLRAVVERYDGDGFLDAPGGIVVRRWLPERALNEAVVEAALGRREPSVFSAPYSVWMYWTFLDSLMREGISAVKAASERAEAGVLVQTDAPGSVSAYVGKPTWEGALAGWAPEADFVVIETFPNAWLPRPLKTGSIARKVERARKVAGEKPVYVLTGYPSGPPELGYTEELQAEFLKGAIEAAKGAGAAGLLWHTIRSTDKAPVKPTEQDVADLKAIGQAVEAGDIFTIINMATSEPWRVERLLTVATEIENFAGLLKADGTGKAGWLVFVEAAKKG